MSQDDAPGVEALEPDCTGYHGPRRWPIHKHTPETGLAHCLNDTVRRPYGADSEKLLSVSEIRPSLIQSGEDPTSRSMQQAGVDSAFAATGPTVQPPPVFMTGFVQDKAPTIQAASVSAVLVRSRSDGPLQGMLEII